MVEIGSPREVFRKYWWLVVVAAAGGIIIGLLLEGMIRAIARQGITLFSIFPGVFAVGMLAILAFGYYWTVTPKN